MILKNKYALLALITVLVIGGFVLYNPVEQLGAQNETEGRIAYVDVQEVFDHHPDKEIAEKELNEAAQSMQSELEEEADELSEEKQQELLQEYQADLSDKEQELIQEVLSKIEGVVESVAEEKEVRLVLDKKNVIYGGYDMTEEVIEYIDENGMDMEETDDE